MTTQEIAEKLVAYCRAGEYQKAYEELYSPEIVSVGPVGSPEETPIQGFEALAEKGKKRQEQMEEFIAGWVSDPLVAGNYITLTMGFECIYKGQKSATKEEEICLYQVKDGKIIKEMFFYDVKAMAA